MSGGERRDPYRAAGGDDADPPLEVLRSQAPLPLLLAGLVFASVPAVAALVPSLDASERLVAGAGAVLTYAAFAGAALRLSRRRIDVHADGVRIEGWSTSLRARLRDVVSLRAVWEANRAGEPVLTKLELVTARGRATLDQETRGFARVAADLLASTREARLVRARAQRDARETLDFGVLALGPDTLRLRDRTWPRLRDQTWPLADVKRVELVRGDVVVRGDGWEQRVPSGEVVDWDVLELLMAERADA
jgi:hypothetical protein